jgi:hypothetical protein
MEKLSSGFTSGGDMRLAMENFDMLEVVLVKVVVVEMDGGG